MATVLEDIGLDEQARDDRILHIFNKADAAEEDVDLPFIATGTAGRALTCSALTGTGIDDVLTQIDRYFAQADSLCEITISPDHGAASAWLHQHAEF